MTYSEIGASLLSAIAVFFIFVFGGVSLLLAFECHCIQILSPVLEVELATFQFRSWTDLSGAKLATSTAFTWYGTTKHTILLIKTKDYVILNFNKRIFHFGILSHI